VDKSGNPAPPGAIVRAGGLTTRPASGNLNKRAGNGAGASTPPSGRRSPQDRLSSSPVVEASDRKQNATAELLRATRTTKRKKATKK
jgi:hypothetical protein